MNVAVVSPRVLIRKAIGSLLVTTGSFASVLDFSSVPDVVEVVDKLRPEVIVVHAIDHLSGTEAVQQLRKLLPEARVLLLSDEDPEDEFWVQTLEAGAWGCLSTSDSPQILVKALMKTAEGERWVTHRVTNLIIENIVRARQADKGFTQNLTPREWEVLGLLANGYSYKEIAARLFISNETARSHVKSIYKKLQVRSRRAAAVCYFKCSHGKSAGLTHSESPIGTPAG